MTSIHETDLQQPKSRRKSNRKSRKKLSPCQKLSWLRWYFMMLRWRMAGRRFPFLAGLFGSLVFLTADISGQAGSELSYELTTETWYEAVDAAGTDIWHIFDKLDTRPSHKVDRIYKSMSPKGEWSSREEHIFDSQLDQWRKKIPATTLTDKTGTLILDAKGKTLLQLPADSSFDATYEAIRNAMQVNGLYREPDLAVPAASQISAFQSQGWTVSNSGGLFTLSKPEQVYILDAANLSLKTRVFENGRMKLENEQYYQRAENGMLLPLSKTSRELKTLSKGECVTMVTQLSYRDFEYRPHAEELMTPRISKHNARVTVAPNPAQNEIHIQASAAGIFEFFSIVDTYGRNIHSGKFPAGGSQILDIRHFPPGIYHLILSGKGLTVAEHFVKN